jgi:hypothetical protein
MDMVRRVLLADAMTGTEHVHELGPSVRGAGYTDVGRPPLPGQTAYVCAHSWSQKLGMGQLLE